MIALYIVAGLALLVAGGDLLVRGAVAAATRLGVSPLLIGLTLVGFGTSTPELVTSLEAALRGSPGVAIGNVVGSNIANILLILGVAALLAPVAVDQRGLKRDGAVVLAATAAVFAVLAWGHVSRLVGLVFIAALVGYLVLAYRGETAEAKLPGPTHDADVALSEALQPEKVWSLPVALLAVAISLGLVVVGARLLVDGAIDLARLAGISETVIGLTIVAVGTSLPELVTSVMAALRKQSAVAFGNVIGSNIYNVLGILGVTAVVQPMDVPADFGWVDLAAFGGSAILLVLFARTGGRVSRGEGAMFIALYAGYIAWLAINAAR
jgi:cation:H+ antiporter